MEIPGYKIIDTLGQGGMATVYLAVQQSFERKVALKVMSSELSRTDPSFGERFIRESRIVSHLVHPNIVTVFDVGEFEGHHFLSMEYVPGRDLKEQRADLSLPERIKVIKDVALALDFAGKKGYVHRDVKPDNIMLHEEDGRALLMDFGIAKAADSVSEMTQTGTAIGTPHYMSPEQAKGLSVDSRSDIYSLGVVLFLMLTGYVPFDAESAVSVGVKHVSEEIPQLPNHIGVFQSVIDKVLAKNPQHRFQTGGELIAALSAITEARLQAIEDVAREIGGSLEAGVEADAKTLLGTTAIEHSPTPSDDVVLAEETLITPAPNTDINNVAFSAEPVNFASVLAGAESQIATAKVAHPAPKSRLPMARLLLLTCLSAVALWGWLPDLQPNWLQQKLQRWQGGAVVIPAEVSAKEATPVDVVEVADVTEIASIRAVQEYDSLHDLRPVVTQAQLSSLQAPYERENVSVEVELTGHYTAAEDNVSADDEAAQLLSKRLHEEEQRRLEQAEEAERLRQIELQRQAAREEKARAKAQALAEARAKAAAKKAAEDKQLALWQSEAEAYMAELKLVGSDDRNAYARYQQMLTVRAQYKPAQRGLQKVEAAVLLAVEDLQQRKDFTVADTELQAAEKYFSDSEHVQQARVSLDAAIDANTPKIQRIKVSALKLDNLNVADERVLSGVERTIYVGFSFADFQKQTSVVQAILFDGAHSMEIAQVPVIVSGRDGSAFFTIERAVHGFNSGGYSVDLILGGDLLASTVFSVEN